MPGICNWGLGIRPSKGQNRSYLSNHPNSKLLNPNSHPPPIFARPEKAGLRFVFNFAPSDGRPQKVKYEVL